MRCLDTCEFPLLRHLLQHAADAVWERAVLALSLGGSMADEHGLHDFHRPRSAAAAATPRGEPHPALDRLAALRVTGPILTRMHARQRRLLAGC